MEKTTSVRLPDAVVEALEKMGKDLRPPATLSAMIRLAAEDYVERAGQSKKKAG